MEDSNNNLFLVVLVLRANKMRELGGKDATTTSVLVHASNMAEAIASVNPGHDCIKCEVTEVIYHNP